MNKPFRVMLIVIAVIIVLTPTLCLRVVSSPVVKPAKSFCIVIDAGHGGIDSGATGIVTGNKESDLNLEISLTLGKKLKALGINVVYTRKTQDGLYGATDSGYKRRDMIKRRDIAISSDADLLVSIHLNKFASHSRRGAQVYYQYADEKSYTLAHSIQRVLNDCINIPQQGRGFDASQGDFWMCKIIKPAVIVECGFLSNEKDDLLFDTLEYREQIAYLIFDGIVSYLTQKTTFFPIVTTR